MFTRPVALSAVTVLALVATASAGRASVQAAVADAAARQPTGTAPVTTTTAPSSTTTTTPTITTILTTTMPTTTSTTTTAPPPAEFVCPEGGIEEVRALQAAVDEGHQPWRLSAPDVAAACTFGIPGTAVEPAGENTFRVTQLSTGKTVSVTLVQPLISEGGLIWVVTSVVPVEGTAPPNSSPVVSPSEGTEQAGLPRTR